MLSYLKSFLTVNSLFNSRPMPIGTAGLIILITLFGVFLVLAIISKITAAKKKKDRLVYLAWQKFYYFFITMGLIGLVYTWFAFEGIPFLSAKIILAIWTIITLVWLFFAAKYLLVTVPKRKKEIKKKQEFEKYLP